MAYNELTDKQKHVIENKGTEAPYTGEYDDFYVPGTFICRRCNLPLFTSQAKFNANCGWPAFDDSFPNAIVRVGENHPFYGQEVRCSNCDAHLGHEYKREGFTEKDTRHCVNSVSIKFVPEGETLPVVLTDTK